MTLGKPKEVLGVMPTLSPVLVRRPQIIHRMAGQLTALSWTTVRLSEQQCQNWGISPHRGTKVFILCLQNFVFSVISHSVTPLHNLRSYLDVWPSRVCYSTGNRSKSPETEFRWCRHNHCRFFRHEIIRHKKLTFWPPPVFTSSWLWLSLTPLLLPL